MKKRIAMLLLSAALVVASLTGCNSEAAPAPSSEVVSVESGTVESSVEESVEESSVEESVEESSEEESTEEVSEEQSAEEAEVQVMGEGETSFYFNVTTADQETTCYEIKTDAETVGAALVDLGLVEGEESEWGLYVKTVNGVTADYNVDGHYWAFYIDGEYAMTGVDSTNVTPGATYAFVVE